VPPVVTRFERPGGLTEADRVRGVAGNLVVLSGANFLDTTDASFRMGVFFDGVRALVDTVTETSASVYVPAGAGTGPITVTNNAGVFVTSTNFFIPPSVRGFTPRGRVGDALSITGLSLRAVSAVTLGGVPVASFTVVSATNIAAVIPTNAPASGALAVESPGGRFLTTSNFVLQPRIFGFTPAGGARGPNVPITGAGLTGEQTLLGVVELSESLFNFDVEVALDPKNGAQNAANFIKQNLDWFQQFPVVYIATDMDDPGEAAAKAIGQDKSATGGDPG
jgi:hypothetical protein